MAQNRKNNQTMDPVTTRVTSRPTPIARKSKTNLQKVRKKTLSFFGVFENGAYNMKQFQRASKDPVLKIQLHPVSLGSSSQQRHSVSSEIPSNPNMRREKWKWCPPTSPGHAPYTCSSWRVLCLCSQCNHFHAQIGLHFSHSREAASEVIFLF